MDQRLHQDAQRAEGGQTQQHRSQRLLAHQKLDAAGEHEARHHPGHEQGAEPELGCAHAPHHRQRHQGQRRADEEHRAQRAAQPVGRQVLHGDGERRRAGRGDGAHEARGHARQRGVAPAVRHPPALEAQGHTGQDQRREQQRQGLHRQPGQAERGQRGAQHPPGDRRHPGNDGCGRESFCRFLLLLGLEWAVLRVE